MRTLARASLGIAAAVCALFPWHLQASCAAGSEQPGEPAQSQVTLQVLGSGGPELTDQRASSSYLLWVDGKARLLLDAGSGSSLHYEQSGARFEDLWAIALTHLHVDHSAALPAYIKGAYFTDRRTDLPILGPAGNERMPATTEFVAALFGPHGAYRYLSDYLDPARDSAFKIVPTDIELQHESVRRIEISSALQLEAIGTHHGPIASVAWRANVGDCSVVFSGDMSNQHQSLVGLASGADLLVMHNAVPESAGGSAVRLHMRPSEIGKIAAAAGVNRLLLSHRMTRTLGGEAETVAQIRKHYAGELSFAEPLQVLEPSGHVVQALD